VRVMIVAIAAGMIVLAGDVSNAAVAANTDRVPPAPGGHRQPTARDVPAGQDNSVEQAMKKMDQDLDRKVKSICRGC
jgi:hypothetical protein